MSSDSSPQFVYKIVSSAPPAVLPEPLPLSPLDEQDGFIHLSTGQQIPLTCDAFFGNTSTLWVFKLNRARLADSIKWEQGGFPHLYGTIGRQDVVAVETFERGAGQTWADAMSASAWLE
ncbi:hypothetical protein E4U42_000914 [Claviceps africana]|uniref:DUF952 domain-containing protein n=1 Tax=Claviceps africana TaxID=83212 RepID=A0A8K0NKJ9_9HYPO|nr:hypothetical protein E4U42_000914 [Claviceps africana]